MRSAHPRPVTLGLATGIVVISSGMTTSALAATTPTATPSTTAKPTTSTPATTTSASATPKATISAKASSTPAGSTKPLATPTASPTKPSTSPSASPSTTPTPTPTPTYTAPSASVTAAQSTVQPGATVLFRISAWASPSENGTVTVTATPSKSTPAIAAPTFTVGCPSRTSCDLKPLPTKQPTTPDVEAQVAVPKSAPSGEKITFTAKVTADGNPKMVTTKVATVTVKAAPTSPTPKPTTSKPHTTSPSSGAGKGGSSGTTAAGGTASLGAGVIGSTYSLGSSLPIGSLPLVNAGVPGISTTIPAGSASNLFPQISPSAAPSPAPGPPADPARRTAPVADSSTIPLSLGSSEFGAQILGLIVLLLGVAIAVTRISLRKTRAAGKPGAGQ